MGGFKADPHPAAQGFCESLQRVELWLQLAGFQAGQMGLLHPGTISQFTLAPAALFFVPSSASGDHLR